jgi:hypothetical protein
MYSQIVAVAKTYRFHARFHVSLIARVTPQLRPNETLTQFAEEAFDRLAADRRRLSKIRTAVKARQ